MELYEILDLMSKPEDLQDPNQIVIVSEYVSGFIDDYENRIYEQKIRVSEEWMDVRKGCRSDKAADSEQMGMPQHRALNEMERTSDRLRRYRSDLKDKLATIMRTKGFR